MGSECGHDESRNQEERHVGHSHPQGSCCCGGHVALDQHFEPIARAAMPAELVDELGSKQNMYGDAMLTDFLLQLEQINKYESLGVNVGESDAILAVYTLSQPTFGVVGEAFLHEHVEGFSRKSFAIALAHHLLHDFADNNQEKVCHGVVAAFNKEETTTEEAVVLNVLTAYDFTNTISDFEVRGLFSVELLEKAYERSAKAMRLAKVAIPDYEGSRRAAYPINEKKAEALLCLAYAYYLANTAEISDDFRINWSGYTENQIAAFYTVTRSEQTLLDISRKQLRQSQMMSNESAG